MGEKKKKKKNFGTPRAEVSIWTDGRIKDKRKEGQG